MKNVQRPADIQALSGPGWARRAGMEAEAIRGVPSLERPGRIRRHHRSRRDVGQRTSIRPGELERAVRGGRDAIALLVNRAVMAPAEQHQVRQGRRPSLGPVVHVMPLPDAYVAAREATGSIAMAQSPP